MPPAFMTLAHAIHLAALYYEGKPWIVLPVNDTDQVNWWEIQKNQGVNTYQKTLKIKRDDSSVIRSTVQIVAMRKHSGGLKIEVDENKLMEDALGLAKIYYENRRDNIHRDEFFIDEGANQSSYWKQQVDEGTVYTNRTIAVIKNEKFIASPPVMKMNIKFV